MTASNSSDRRELIVVTGASTGMGAATARELARRGFHVLAGVRRDIDADALRGDGIEPLMPSLLRSSGTVVNISSIGGKVALPTYSAYAGSKFAMEALSDSMRREVSGLGVKVVVIEPGAVQTAM